MTHVMSQQQAPSVSATLILQRCMHASGRVVLLPVSNIQIQSKHADGRNRASGTLTNVSMLLRLQMKLLVEYTAGLSTV
jgi:hypothetical protein